MLNFSCKVLQHPKINPGYAPAYYGKTECHLNVRSSEHIGISPLTGKRVECKPSSLLDHLLLNNHDSNFNNFALLC